MNDAQSIFFSLFKKPNFKGGIKFVLTYDNNREFVFGNFKSSQANKSEHKEPSDVPSLEHMHIEKEYQNFGLLVDHEPACPVVAIHKPSFFWDIVTRRNLALGEGFVNKQWEMLEGSVCDFIRVGLVNLVDKDIQLDWKVKLKIIWSYAIQSLFSNLNEDNSEHYDIGDSVMVPMLGKTGNYTCGYVLDHNEDLDQMQTNKMNLVLGKLRLKPGERLLDLGCGNGGLLIHAALHFGVTGQGFTNSVNMVRVANQNIARNGLSEKLFVENDDFGILARFPDEHFDVITTIGNFEHIPHHLHGGIIAECKRILKPHGRMLVHAISSLEHVNVHEAFIQKYIFPDSGQLVLSLLQQHVEKLRMYTADIENIGRHYFFTLRQWYIKLMQAAVKDPNIDPRTLRMFQYYLQSCMAVSYAGDALLSQVLIWKDPRQCKFLHRVTAENMKRFPLTMKPSDENNKMDNEQAVKQKKEKEIYRPPSLCSRFTRLFYRVLNFLQAGHR